MHDALKFYDKEDRPWPSNRLTSSAIVGHTSAKAARIWFRAWTPGDYCLVLSREPIEVDRQPAVEEDLSAAFTRASNGRKRRLGERVEVLRDVGYGTDITGVFDVRDLEPGTRYHYAVFALDEDRSERWEIGRDHAHSFRTAAPDAESVRFGLFSCHMPFKGRDVRNMHMWQSFRQVLEIYDADFVVAGGDQVYTDGDDGMNIWRWLRKKKSEVARLSKADQIDVMLSWYRDIYRGYWGDLELRRVFRGWPTYMIWDDHEIMDGWGSYTRTELSNTLDSLWEWENKKKNVALAYNMFEAAKQAYFEYQHSHNPKTPAGQWDYSFRWNQCAFFVMDMRGQRSYRRKQYRILGQTQFRRLAAWLKSPKVRAAKVLFLVSPVPVIHLKDFVTNHLDLTLLGLADDLRDEWEHESNLKERDQLLDLVFKLSEQEGKRIVFLSGDVHISAAFKLTRESTPGAEVYQLTSSGITYCKAPGKALALAAKKNGELKLFKPKRGQRKGPRTFFRRLDLFVENNFGLVTVGGAEDPGRVAWDLYGASDDENEIVRRRRVVLD
ncbi:MAG: alkaline phosphatase D family protein [Planctomycetota bacterium]